MTDSIDKLLGGKSQKNTATLPNGYMYEFSGKRDWQRSSDEKWEIVVRDDTPGMLLGRRRIDGVVCYVVKGQAGMFAAQRLAK